MPSFFFGNNMEMKTTVCTVLIVYLTLISLDSLTCRVHSHNHRNKHIHPNPSTNEIRPWRQQSTTDEEKDTYDPPNIPNSSKKQHNGHKYHRRQEEESDEYDGRHAYVMTTDHLKKSAPEDEDQTLNQAFEKHMKAYSTPITNPHDVYAYKLPSDLWFIVRYTKNAEGQVDKYMNVVSSFTNYLDKLDSSAKSVSVNVQGVETVFRLTSKSKPTT